jgi:hypothetical protein
VAHGAAPEPAAVQRLPDDARVSASLIAVERWRPESSATPAVPPSPAVQRSAGPGAVPLPLVTAPAPEVAPVLAYLPPLQLGLTGTPTAPAAAGTATTPALVQRLAGPAPSAPPEPAAPALPSLLTTVRPEAAVPPLPGNSLPVVGAATAGPRTAPAADGPAVVQRSWGGGSADVPGPRTLAALPGPLPGSRPTDASLPTLATLRPSAGPFDAPVASAPSAPAPVGATVQRLAAQPARSPQPARSEPAPRPPVPGVTDPGTFALTNGLGRMDEDGSVVFDIPGLTVSRSIATSTPAPARPGLQSPMAAAPPTAVAAPVPAPEPVLQREVAAEATPEPAPTEAPPPAAAPAPAPAAAAAPGTPGGMPLEELARQLYDPLAARLKAELWLDRERAGLITDLRR